MMHAKNLATPESRAPSNEQPANGLRQRSSADRDYYHRRAVQKDEAAARASCYEARNAHEKLAAAYGQLCQSNGAFADPSLFFSAGSLPGQSQANRLNPYCDN